MRRLAVLALLLTALVAVAMFHPALAAAPAFVLFAVAAVMVAL